MKRQLVAALVATVVLAVGVLASLSARDSSGSDDDARNAAGKSRGQDDDRGHGRGAGREKADKGEHGDHAPPAWAHGKDAKSDKTARDEWRELSPEERRTLMDELIREHMEGMQEWRDCMVEARDDCELPTPPGLAKLR
jgi:hypothetical protein